MYLTFSRKRFVISLFINNIEVQMEDSYDKLSSIQSIVGKNS